ncbi:outer membrane beta-barrel protein [Marivirga tractuosa]|uniref:outer membrane beta-barrel protein n=1 Tax=Marivirga tractuosa TaxID=1006 RepID=UPI0035CFA9BF
MLSTAFCQAQSVWDKLNKNPFKNSQFYVGLRAGANYNAINVINRYSLIKPTNSLDEGLYDKQYQEAENVGVLYGITFMYQFEQRLVLGFNASVNQIRFQYTQEQPGSNRSVNFIHNHNLNYLDVPIFFRYMFRKVNSRFWDKSNKKPTVPAIVPFAQIGINFSVLLNADKEYSKFTTQNGVESREFDRNEDIKSIMSPTMVGAFIGGGARFRVGTFYLTAEANFRQGLSNANNQKARYVNENLQNQAYDVMDDFSFQSVEAIIGVIFPLKYLSKKEFMPVEI